jgi:hypothetical protein
LNIVNEIIKKYPKNPLFKAVFFTMAGRKCGNLLSSVSTSQTGRKEDS